MLLPNEHVLEHVDDYLHDNLSTADAAQLERHCDACPICNVALDEARKRRDVLATLPPCEASGALVQATLNRIDVHRRGDTRLRKLLRWGATSAAAAAVVIGCLHWYYAHLSPTPYDLEVLGQSSLLAGSPGSLRVRLIDHVSGAALAGVPVAIELRDTAAGQVAALAHFDTDAWGTGQPRFTLPDWKDGTYELRVTARPDGKTETTAQPVRLRRSWKLMLSSDKPVYQPGQTIHLRGLTLRRPDLKPVAGHEAVFTVTDPHGNLIFKRHDATSKYGIVADDCALATEITEGAYTVACAVGDTESKLTVEVKKYVLPKFKVRLDLDRPYYEPGQPVHGTVHADYFFGKPVPHADVALTPRSNDTALESLKPLHCRTNDAGVAEFDLKLPAPEESSAEARFQLDALVTDSAGQKQTATVARNVTGRTLRVEVFPEGGTVVPGITNRMYVLATYADGRPARVRFWVSGHAWDLMGPKQELRTDAMGAASFEIAPTTFESTLARNVDLKVSATDEQGRKATARLPERERAPNDFLLRTNRAVYRGGDTMWLTALGGGAEPVFVDLLKDGQTLLTATVGMTDGRGEAQVDLPPDLFGTIELSAYRLTPSGLPLRKTRVLYVHRADQLRVRARLDRRTYHPGDKAGVAFTVTDAAGRPTPGALSLAAVDEAVFSVLEQRPGMEGTFYTLDRKLLEPVYEIYPWSPEMSGGMAAMQRNEFEQALFASTVQTTSGGHPGIPDFEQRGRSPYSLAAESFLAKARQAESRRDRGLVAVWIAWCVLAAFVLVMAYAVLWRLVPPDRLVLVHALSLTALLCGCFCSGFLSESGVMHKRRPASRGLVLLDDSSRRWAFTPVEAALSAPIWADSDNDDESAGFSMGFGAAGRRPHPRVRNLFPETLLWQPQLITDDRGRARLDVDLADSITTWRLTASAVSADGQLGAAQAGIRVSQPFFVDLNLPVALTRGDEVDVPFVVYNYLDRPQTVRLTLKEAGWFTRLDEPARVVTVAAHQVRGTGYRIRVTRVGRHNLEVDAHTPEAADAVRRTIDVVPDGSPVEQVVNGSLGQPARIALDLPADAIDGSAKAILKVYPSGFSQLVEGLDAIFQRPYGCFEQASSTTYPNVLALDYLRRTHKSVPAVEAKAREYIHLGYQRLLGFEVEGGGFDWFGRPPANRTLTAYGLMEFQDMARIHDVDPHLIERTRAWLLGQRQADGSWAPEGHSLESDPTRGEGDLARLSTTAYIAWAIFGGGHTDATAETTRKYLLTHPAAALDDPHILALVANALLAITPNGRDALPYLERLATLRQASADGKQVWWRQPAGRYTTFYGAGRSGGVEVAALAALAFMQAGREPALVRGALSWVVAQKDGRGTWYSTQATVLALKALVMGTGSGVENARERRIEIALGDRWKKTLTIPADQADVMQQIDLSAALRPGTQRLTLRESTGTDSLFQVVFRYHVPRQARQEAGPLAIDLAYDRTRLAVEDTVAVQATVVNRGKRVAPMVMLELPIPGGFTVAADDLAAAKGVAKCQVTPRSAIVYLRGLEPGKPLTLRYRLRAKMPVKVSVPPARVYEYYDEDRQAFSRAAALTVTAR